MEGPDLMDTTRSGYSSLTASQSSGRVVSGFKPVSLYTRLEPLKLYALRQNSLIDCELAAYQTAFDILNKALGSILADAFVQTAEGEGLALHEKLVGLHERPGVGLETRRALVIYRKSIAPFDFNLSGMVNSVRAVGMEAEIIEDYAGERLKIISKNIIDDFADLDSVKASLFTMLPAHLEAEFDIGFMTWDMFDGYGVSWDEWDVMDFTWEQFDIDADKLFES